MVRELFGDVTDSRDVIERIDELQSERDNIEEHAGERWDESEEIQSKYDRETYIADSVREEMDEDDLKELAALKAFAEEAEGYSSDWPHGETIIADSYFTEYTEELCKDCGYLNADKDNKLPWWIEIDWEKTADNVKADYTSIEYDGRDYWIRSC